MRFVVFLFSALAILAGLAWAAESIRSTPKVGLTQEESSIAIGQPCELRGGTDLPTLGLQCYWYGEVSDRRGIWVRPELRLPSDAPYQELSAHWLSGRTPDGKLTFRYPRPWHVYTEYWKNERVLHIGYPPSLGDLPFAVSIMLLDPRTGAIGIDDQIAEMSRHSSDTHKRGTVAGERGAIRIDAVSKDTLTPDETWLFIPRLDTAYYAVRAVKTRDPFDDFVAEAIVRSMAVK